MDRIKHRFGDKIKTLRKIRGMTQEQLAECLGLNVRQISRIESGVNFVSLETMKMMCFIFNLNVGKLMDISLPPEETVFDISDKILHYTAEVTNKGTKFSKTDGQEIFYIKNFSCDRKEPLLCDIARKHNQSLIVSFMEKGIIKTDIIYFTNGVFRVYNREKFKQIDDRLMKLFNEIVKISQNEMMLDFVDTAVKACKKPTLRKEMRVLLDGMDLADKMK